jgi:apolipoprotein N-acyltransferase
MERVSVDGGPHCEFPIAKRNSHHPTGLVAVTTAACVLVSGFAFGLSSGVFDFWPLAWLAPFPVLWLALEVSARRAAVAAFLAFALGRLWDLPILVRVAPAASVAAATLLPPLGFAAIVVASRAVARRLDLRLYALAFPLFWTAWEQLVVLPIGVSWERGFTQADLLPLVQLASLTGVVGVSFAVSLAPALAATALALRRRGRAWRGISLAGIAGIATVFAFGCVRLRGAPAGEPVRLGVAVSDQAVGRFRTESASAAMEVVDAYARRVARLAGRGAQVVVLPEKLVGVTPAYADTVEARFSRAAAEGGVWLVAGLNRIGTETPRNVALVFAPDGSRVLEYDKIHLVPGFEDAYAPGRELGLLPSAPGPWGIAICRDLIVPELGPRLARAGVRLVLDPAWDFGVDGPLESRVARLRAVENGFALVRAAKEGVPTASDAYGRALLAHSTSDEGEVIELVEIAAGPGATFYARHPGWFGIATAACAAALLVALALAGRRSSGRQPDSP